MSHVEFKNIPCRMSLGSPLSHVDFKESPCRRVEFKKRPCSPVDFRGLHSSYGPLIVGGSGRGVGGDIKIDVCELVAVYRGKVRTWVHLSVAAGHVRGVAAGDRENCPCLQFVAA